MLILQQAFPKLWQKLKCISEREDIVDKNWYQSRPNASLFGRPSQWIQPSIISNEQPHHCTKDVFSVSLSLKWELAILRLALQSASFSSSHSLNRGRNIGCGAECLHTNARSARTATFPMQ